MDRRHSVAVKWSFPLTLTFQPRMDTNRHEWYSLAATGQNEVKAVTARQVFDGEGRREFVVTNTAVTQGGEKPRAVVLSRMNPEVNVLGECGGAVEDGGLAANQRVFDAMLIKVTEKVCDHGWPAGRAGGSAWPTNDSDVRPESAFSKRLPYRAIEPHGALTRALAPAGMVRRMAARLLNPRPISPPRRRAACA